MDQIEPDEDIQMLLKKHIRNKLLRTSEIMFMLYCLRIKSSNTLYTISLFINASHFLQNPET